MSAQEEWKSLYCSRKVLLKYSLCGDIDCKKMRSIRREAALERKLAAAQRTIEALQMQVWKLEAQEHNRDDGNEWEKEYYLRGMHR